MKDSHRVKEKQTMNETDLKSDKTPGGLRRRFTKNLHPNFLDLSQVYKKEKSQKLAERY